MTSPAYAIPYPRNVGFRRAVRFVSRILLRLLTRTTVTGRENLPVSGPLILVGNHVDIMEVVLMIMHVPYLIEVMGTGDIPLDPSFKWIIEPYGFIPINRGNMDRKGLNMALDVLKQGGVIGIFPEGGIWEANAKQARTGVAWLSQMANAPVLPIGFGGVYGAFANMAALKRPRMTMTIGTLMPPVTKDSAAGRKTALDDAAARIMAQVEALIPNEDKQTHAPAAETFDFDLSVITSDGARQPRGSDFTPTERAALGKLFARPVLLNTFARNMRLPVQPLKEHATERSPALIAHAAASIVDYIEQTNPQFFNYRFGYDDGAAVHAALIKLRDIAREAAHNTAQIELAPTAHRDTSASG